MKKFLLAVAALACLGGGAYAGVNEGGTIFVHDANIAYTTDILVYCGGVGTDPASCDAADVRIDGDTPQVFKVFAAFRQGTTPRLKGIVFGITYGASVQLPAFGPCAEFELPDDGWPASGTGNALVWDNIQQGLLTPVYWFAGYSYYGEPALFASAPHPTQGGSFADDSIPSFLDPIAGYGTLGFNADGQVACPGTGPAPGACCFTNGSCVVLLEADCVGQGGIFQGENVPCEPDNPCPQPPIGVCCDTETGACTLTIEQDCQPPLVWHAEWTSCEPENPCAVTPTERSSWGQIKHSYR